MENRCVFYVLHDKIYKKITADDLEPTAVNMQMLETSDILMVVFINNIF